MRKLVVLEHVSLDGFIHAPGGPEKDRSGGFADGTIPPSFKVTESIVTHKSVIVVNYE